MQRPNAVPVLSPAQIAPAHVGREIQPADGPAGGARWFKPDGELLMWTGNDGWTRFMGPGDWRPIISPAYLSEMKLPPFVVYTQEVMGHA